MAYNNGATGATGATDASFHTYGVASALSANGFVRTSYSFVGWATAADLPTVEYEDEDKVQTLTAENGATVHLYARWTTNRYTVTFNVDNGNPVPDAQVVEPDEKVTEPVAPTKTGYIFAGWYSNAGFTSLWTFPTGVVTENMMLYAKWIPEGATIYTVTFSSNGGSSVPDVPVESGGKIPEPSVPTKPGNNFLGWYSNEELTTAWRFSAGTVAQHMTLYAKWSPYSYTVAFNSNSGSPVSSVQVEPGGKVNEPTPPTKEDYTFIGWYFDDGLSMRWYFSTNVVTENTTLYAKWVENSVPACIVTFDSRGGSNLAADTAPYGATVTHPADPTKAGYTFAGWYANATLTVRWNFPTDEVTRDTTLYAGWIDSSATVFTITFDSRGGSPIDAQTVAYDSMLMYPVPTLPSYTFKDWYMEPECNYPYKFSEGTRKSRTLYAGWTPVRWKLDSITINNVSQKVTGNTIDYVVPCSANVETTQIEITYRDSAAILQRLIIPATRPFKLDTAILQGRYTIRLEKKFDFDSIALTLLGGKLLAALNNPKYNGGFHLQEVKWWQVRDSENLPLSSKFYYASPSGGVIKDSIYLQLLDSASGVWLKSCPYAYTPPAVPTAQRLAVYPNPVASGKAIHLKEEFLINDNLEEHYATLSLIDIQGKVVYVGNASELRKGLVIPDIPVGVYHIILEGKAGRKVLKIAVTN